MDLIRQASGQGQGQGQGQASRTQLQRRQGGSRAGAKEPMIKIEIPASVMRPPGAGGGPDLEMLKQLASGGGSPGIPQPPEV